VIPGPGLNPANGDFVSGERELKSGAEDGLAYFGGKKMLTVGRR